MKTIKKSLLILAVALTCGAYTGMAQIYVHVRPHRPHYTRVVAPSPRHVWIDEDWEARGNDYVFIGGRWVLPPRDHARWIPGHWRTTPDGDMWIAGHWRY